MKPSPLQLNGYFFTDDSVTCQYGPSLPDTEVVLDVGDIECEIQSLDKEEPDPWVATIRLKVATKHSEEADSLHYGFSIEAIGNIQFKDPGYEGRDSDFAERALVLNGANLLFGVIRERLHTKTATMMWGPLILPLVTFDGIRKLPGGDINSQEDKQSAAG